MIQIHITDDFMADGVAIFVSMKYDGGRKILRLRTDGMREWADHEALTVTEPTLKLQEDEARALLDALLRHYQGASDMHSARADLIHERNRVDKLTSGLMQIAIHASGSAFGTGQP